MNFVSLIVKSIFVLSVVLSSAFSAADQPKLDCFERMTLPKIALDSNKIPYFVFQDLDQARNFLKTAFDVTRDRLDKRAEYLIPVLNGFREIYRKSDTRALTSKDKMDIRSPVTMWLHTPDQIQLDDKTMEELYQIAIRITGSDLFQSLNYSTAAGNFSEIYRSLNRQPPEKQLVKWLESFSSLTNENYRTHVNFLWLLPILNLNDSVLRLAKTWLKKEEQLDPTEIDLVRKGHALNSLYLVAPTLAYDYFNRHKSEFITLDLDKPHLVVRPIAYFKYVMKRDVPVFDMEVLKKYFADGGLKASSAEQQVGGVLSSLGVKFEQNAFDSLAPFIELDFLIKLEDGRRINVEVDGPQHFFKDSAGALHPRLADRRRDEILNALGIKVYRIPYFELSDINAVENRLLQLLTE